MKLTPYKTEPLTIPAGSEFDTVAEAFQDSLADIAKLDTVRRRAWGAYYGNGKQPDDKKIALDASDNVQHVKDTLAHTLGDITPPLPHGDPSILFPHLSVKHPLSSSTPEEGMIRWLLERKRGLGGSDILSALGLDTGTSWSRTQQQLMTEKNTLELGKDEWKQVFGDQTGALLWGSKLETLIAHMYSDMTGRTVVEVKDTLLSDTVWQTLNVDGVIVNSSGQPMGILEVKTTSKNWDGDIPDQYVAQVLNYLDATGLTQADLIVLVGMDRVDVYHLTVNDTIKGLSWVDAKTELDNVWSRICTDFSLMNPGSERMVAIDSAISTSISMIPDKREEYAQCEK